MPLIKSKPVYYLLVVLIFSVALVAWTAAYVASDPKLANSLSWRLELIESKLRGKVHDLSWLEIWAMTTTAGGFGLESKVIDQRSLAGSIVNPYTNKTDVGAGRHAFEEYCARCHGGSGEGASGPSLDHPNLAHGDSEFSLYKMIRDGAPERGMPRPPLSWRERWQVLAYIRTLQLKDAMDVHVHMQRPIVSVSVDDLYSQAGDGSRWLTYSNTFDGHRYASLHQITRANVSRLRLKWVRQLGGSAAVIEATPLVADGVVFVTRPPATVMALEVKSGRQLWSYARPLPPDLPLCCGPANRGVALLGTTLFYGALDGYLVAIDANSGAQLWQVKVADPSLGYSLTGAPLVAGNQVVVGVAGGEFGARGFVAAYHPVDGKEAWKFFTIPGPSEPGHETWKSDAWRTGGGATWTTGSYDPALNLVYWGVGNPSPPFSGDARPGDNLYTDSVIAINASTGRLAWHFQFTPHDEHDWDSVQTPILADLMVSGVKRRAICWANRNGFYYVLDRTNGEFLAGRPYVEQNWSAGLDARGKPLPVQGPPPGPDHIAKPGVNGGTNWQNPAFDSTRQLVFIPSVEAASVYSKDPEAPKPPRGHMYLGSVAREMGPVKLAVKAIDAATGNLRWETISSTATEYPNAYSGLLATAGSLVFGAARGELFALDSDNGRELWRIPLGGPTLAPPISFSVDGHQVILVSSGDSLFAFGL